MSKPTLKPCPFCGAEPREWWDNGSRGVECVNSACGVRPTAFVESRIKAEAHAAWNRRVKWPSAPTQNASER